PVTSGATPSNPNLDKSRLSTKTSITRTGLFSLIQSARHSGKSVACPRSIPSTKRFIRPPAASNHCCENHTKRRVFTQPGSNCDMAASPCHFRSSPISRHSSPRPPCRRCAKTDHNALQQKSRLLDHLVGGREHRGRNFEPKRVGSLEVDHCFV